MYDDTDLKPYMALGSANQDGLGEKYPDVKKLVKDLSKALGEKCTLTGNADGTNSYYSLRVSGQTFGLSVRLHHYSGCCGACYMAGLSISMFSKEKLEGFLKTFCAYVHDNMGYTQIQYIVKAHYQKEIREALLAVGFKTISEFQNKRTHNHLLTLAWEKES